MPGSTPAGIRYPLTSEPPNVAPDMQRLATDVDGLIAGPYGVVGLDANQGPVATTGVVMVGAWVSRYVRGGVLANANGLVAPVAGWYEVDAWARFQVLANAVVRLVIGNGAAAVVGEAYGAGPIAATYNVSLFIRRTLQLAASEQIRCGYNQATASTVTMVGGAPLTGLSARLIQKT